MIICKRPDPQDDYLQEARTTTTTITTGVRGLGGYHGDWGDGTEGGEKGKGGEETLAHGQADGPIEGRTRGPRRENKKSVKCKKAGEGKLQSGIKSCQ